MAEERGFVGQVHPRDIRPVLPDFEDDFDYVVDVALGVDASGIARRTRSIFAALANMSVPISTLRIPPSRYNSAASATPETASEECAAGRRARPDKRRGLRAAER